ncbi:uncharacterized protein LOC117293674 [Asterias rubens]|uniref:uncharacterized protein LOC117293674 n=1 Tax=Asterias rubens TaxID=7604 RepID=UPI0014553BE2|nr:uncharacterized protein LOC117293674 [Asterias rubens]XP_033631962.1 uncharacterized protein LOC117293674 [Asterias rubens]XP_033631963.1 uncharacterized protein LOC117293674 [Asterias rubens]
MAARWSGFGDTYDPRNTELKSVCFSHFDEDGDGVLNKDEFHNLCCDLFTIDGNDRVVSKTDSAVMMALLEGQEEAGINKEDFDYCWSYWFKQILTPRAALFVVDVQHDFIDGSLSLRNCAAHHDGADVVPVINKLLEALTFDLVVYTKDFHPPDHLSFYDNLHLRKLHSSSKVKAKDAKLLDTVVFDSKPLVDQILWPVHCVQGTRGEELHPDLKIAENHIVVTKGTDSDRESYSVFMDNAKKVNTALIAELRQRAITDIYICGLAYDFCVGLTAMDAQNFGYRTMVIEDATRGVCHKKMGDTKQGLLDAGCVVGDTSEVAAMLSKRTRHPRWGMVAARSVAKARTLTKGQPDTVKLKKEIPCRDRNQNGTSLCYDDIGFEQDSIEL